MKANYLGTLFFLATDVSLLVPPLVGPASVSFALFRAKELCVRLSRLRRASKKIMTSSGNPPQPAGGGGGPQQSASSPANGQSASLGSPSSAGGGYIGARISLITTYDIRYEGILIQLNQKESREILEEGVRGEIFIRKWSRKVAGTNSRKRWSSSAMEGFRERVVMERVGSAVRVVCAGDTCSSFPKTLIPRFSSVGLLVCLVSPFGRAAREVLVYV